MAQLTLHSALVLTKGADRVPRRLVHRLDAEDVFPTIPLAQHSDTLFSASAHWPRAHRFFVPVAGRHQDPLLIAETMRQMTIALVHEKFAVPQDHMFVMGDLSYTAEPALLLLDDDGPWDISISVSFAGVRGGRISSWVQVDHTLHHRGEVLARGGGRIRCVSPEGYRRLRGDRDTVDGAGSIPLLPAVAPREVGRTREDDVVLAPTEHRDGWQLRVDPRHRTLFGRSNDHVPGILLLEAARQAAQAATPDRAFLPVSLSADFLEYVELDRPCLVGAERVPSGDPSRDRVRVRAVQDGVPVLACVLDAPRAPLPQEPLPARSLSAPAGCPLPHDGTRDGRS